MALRPEAPTGPRDSRRGRPRWVKTHINHLFSKTGVRDLAQLVGYAFRNGLAFPG